MSETEGLNFEYYSKVGNRVMSIMKKIGLAMTEKLLTTAVENR